MRERPRVGGAGCVLRAGGVGGGVLQGTHTAMDLALGQGHTAVARVLERAAAARR